MTPEGRGSLLLLHMGRSLSYLLSLHGTFLAGRSRNASSCSACNLGTKVRVGTVTTDCGKSSDSLLSLLWHHLNGEREEYLITAVWSLSPGSPLCFDGMGGEEPPSHQFSSVVFGRHWLVMVKVFWLGGCSSGLREQPSIETFVYVYWHFWVPDLAYLQIWDKGKKKTCRTHHHAIHWVPRFLVYPLSCICFTRDV